MRRGLMIIFGTFDMASVEGVNKHTQYSWALWIVVMLLYRRPRSVLPNASRSSKAPCNSVTTMRQATPEPSRQPSHAIIHSNCALFYKFSRDIDELPNAFCAQGQHTIACVYSGYECELKL